MSNSSYSREAVDARNTQGHEFQLRAINDNVSAQVFGTDKILSSLLNVQSKEQQANRCYLHLISFAVIRVGVQQQLTNLNKEKKKKAT